MGSRYDRLLKLEARAVEQEIELTPQPVSYTHLTLPTSDLV